MGHRPKYPSQTPGTASWKTADSATGLWPALLPVNTRVRRAATLRK